MKQISLWMTVVLGLIVCNILVSGCTNMVPKNSVNKSSYEIPEPESGIVRWIVAVNNRDYGAVYDLMPQSKRTGITREQYILLNTEHPSVFLSSGMIVNNFTVLDKQVVGKNATIAVGLDTIRVSKGQNGAVERNFVYVTFDEVFEDREWKVWTS